MKKELMEKYARLIVRSGVNVQKGQLLVINAAVKDYEFIRMCVREAFEAGAGEVEVKWSDEIVNKLVYENETAEVLADVPDWVPERTRREHEKKACYLSVHSGTPGLLKDIDPAKMKQSRMAYMKKMAPYMSYTMNNEGQWCVAALPSAGWAKLVFPDLEEEEAIEALTKAILMSVRITDDNDPVEEWKNHDRELMEHCDILNEFNFKTLHFVSELGTDLYVDLVKDHIWVGGGCTTPDGVFFNPNMPTEECFCMPHRLGVTGKVVASKPLSHNGKVIEGFWFEFKDGVVVNYGAEKEYDTLKDMLETDEGSRHLGEVALISYDSPISRSNILFYNTLFDENASCHLALGRCYPENVKGGIEMNESELAQVGGNSSLNHVDFMFGTRDMHVTGIRHDGSEVTVFDHGNFVV